MNFETRDIAEKGINDEESGKIVEQLYRDRFHYLLSIANRFASPTGDSYDLINEFFLEKMLLVHNKDVLKKMLDHPHYMGVVFKNFIIDQVRKRSKGALKHPSVEIDKYILEIEDVSNVDSILELEGQVEEAKDVILGSFKNEKYAEVFDLLLEGHTNLEIANLLKIGTAHIDVIKHRIRKLLKMQLLQPKT